jgi:hypothetical protein
LNGQCSGRTREGTRCTRSVEGPNGLCWLHDPTRAEDRRRAAGKAGRSKPNRELQDIKTRLSELADDVLEGTVDKGKAAVCGQLYNTLLRAIGTELKIREQEVLLERVEELEEILERQNEYRNRGQAW